MTLTIDGRIVVRGRVLCRDEIDLERDLGEHPRVHNLALVGVADDGVYASHPSGPTRSRIDFDAMADRSPDLLCLFVRMDEASSARASMWAASARALVSSEKYCHAIEW